MLSLLPLVASTALAQTPLRTPGTGNTRPNPSTPFATTRQQPQKTTARWSEVQRHKVAPDADTWRLRWRTPRQTVATEAERQQPKRRLQPALPFARPAQGEPEPVSDLVFRETNTDAAPAAVRQASHQAPSSPFDDPFGDLQSPAPAAPPASVLEDEAPPPPPRELKSEIAILQEPPAAAETPEPEAPRTRGDCAADIEACREARRLAHNSSIRTISLDITPQLTLAKAPGQRDRPYEEAVEEALQDAPDRTWRDRAGNVLGEGRMSDYRNGRVVIKTADGTLQRLPFGQLSDEDMCFVAAWWSIPAECALVDESAGQRDWTAATLTWKASSTGYKPLYFEEVQLERYGHTAGPVLQPAVSGAHFFLNIATLPYQMGISPPTECEYPLGYYRPGNCAPWLVPPIPLSVRGALAEAGAILGGIYVLP